MTAPVLGQSEIVCMVTILDVQGDTAIGLCRECSLARRRALAFRRGALGLAARAHIVERTSGPIRMYKHIQLLTISSKEDSRKKEHPKVCGQASDP